MSDKLKKTKEQILKEIRERNKRAVAYDDWWYDLLEVEVCDIDTGNDKVYRVPKYVGEIVCNIVKDTTKNNEIIELGDVKIRAYMVRRMEFTKARFTSMSDWSKKMSIE